jgi:hypothetical protein
VVRSGEKALKAGSGMARSDTPAPREERTGTLPFDPSVAHQARIYDYLLGGKDNYPADRAAAEELARTWPGLAFSARANRAFLGRAVRYLTGEAGIRQFLDIGTGIPTAGSTHQVAQAVAPESRVVSVDYDPVVLAHARALLVSAEKGSSDYVHADVRDTPAVLAEAGKLLDFTRPTAVMLLAILHAMPDSDNPRQVVAQLMDAVPSGSYLVITHTASDLLGQESRDGVKDVVGRMVQQDGASRDREQLLEFFAGLDLVDPGLVRVEEWRPEPEADVGSTEKSALWGAVARKP